MLNQPRRWIAAAVAGSLVWAGCSEQSDRSEAAEMIFDRIEFATAHEVKGKETTNSGLLYDVEVDASFTPADLTMPDGFTEGPLDDQVDFIGPDPVEDGLDCIVTVGMPADIGVERLVTFDVACGFHDATN